ncbi:hypothetical protein BGZ47_001616 [Haplosporangium gracile]|nr:hypothetical protein BGZ47_001589 [Haplosporangium gracile]KAF8948901.1 hypothetical protein BGZ47_001616 [Haplosporangium gracile]
MTLQLSTCYRPISLPENSQLAPTTTILLKGNNTSNDPPSAYDRANVFSRVIFHYIQSLMSTGYRRAETDTGTANMMPHSVRTASSFQRLERLWRRHLEKKITEAKSKDGGEGVSLL